MLLFSNSSVKTTLFHITFIFIFLTISDFDSIVKPVFNGHSKIDKTKVLETIW